MTFPEANRQQAVRSNLTSLLEARAAALIRGASRLPPIEHDLASIPPHSVMSASQACVSWAHMRTTDASGVSILVPVYFPLRPPLAPGAAHLQKQPFLPANQAFYPPVTSNTGQQCHYMLHCTVPRACINELCLPVARIPLDARLVSPTQSVGGFSRLRRSSDYADVSPATMELTLHSLAESLLRSASSSRAALNKHQGNIDETNTRIDFHSANDACRTSAPPLPFTETKLVSSSCKTSQCNSRCSTVVGPSRVSYIEEDIDDDDDGEDAEDGEHANEEVNLPGHLNLEETDGNLGFVPKPKKILF